MRSLIIFLFVILLSPNLGACSATDERKGFRYVYYVTFPKIRIFDGEKFRYGMFNFTVEYKRFDVIRALPSESLVRWILKVNPRHWIADEAVVSSILNA